MMSPGGAAHVPQLFAESSTHRFQHQRSAKADRAGDAFGIEWNSMFGEKPLEFLLIGFLPVTTGLV
jgi:hypothetical protein